MTTVGFARNLESVSGHVFLDGARTLAAGDQVAAGATHDLSGEFFRLLHQPSRAITQRWNDGLGGIAMLGDAASVANVRSLAPDGSHTIARLPAMLHAKSLVADGVGASGDARMLVGSGSMSVDTAWRWEGGAVLAGDVARLERRWLGAHAAIEEAYAVAQRGGRDPVRDRAAARAREELPRLEDEAEALGLYGNDPLRVAGDRDRLTQQYARIIGTEPSSLTVITKNFFDPTMAGAIAARADLPRFVITQRMDEESRAILAAAGVATHRPPAHMPEIHGTAVVGAGLGQAALGSAWMGARTLGHPPHVPHRFNGGGELVPAQWSTVRSRELGFQTDDPRFVRELDASIYGLEAPPHDFTPDALVMPAAG